MRGEDTPRSARLQGPAGPPCASVRLFPDDLELVRPRVVLARVLDQPHRSLPVLAVELERARPRMGALARLLGGARALALDAPQHGLSGPREGGVTVGAVAGVAHGPLRLGVPGTGREVQVVLRIDQEPLQGLRELLEVDPVVLVPEELLVQVPADVDEDAARREEEESSQEE